MGLSSILMIITTISLFFLLNGVNRKNKLMIWFSLITLLGIAIFIVYFIFLTPDYM
ncbi:hypothetical protein A5886_001131 [Enterococcus sp. 8G7_MSG3316]|uniref:DUF2759 domain-containing protein n=1 Tax=Candidatus Enterococcus testudinis TaxID=1834191 RepID=A0A242A4U5_9ENTE|nr:hypothetical protein A5886_001131 [Enterococcus sp. 8G7_MSG3316]